MQQQHEYPNPYRALARAIVLQALMDLGSKRDSSEASYYRFEAEQWLFGSSPGYYMICDIAEYHPSRIKTVAQRIKDKGMSWRAPAGQGKRYEERKLYREKLKRFSVRSCMA